MSSNSKKDNSHLFVCYPVKQNKNIEDFKNSCSCGKGLGSNCAKCKSAQQESNKNKAQETIRKKVPKSNKIK